jgi:hypothetical protein
MTGTDMQTWLQDELTDTSTSWSPDAYLRAINYSQCSVAKQRCDKADAQFVFPLGIVNGQDEPANFYKFAGTNPIEIRNLGSAGRKWYYTGSTQPTVKYYRLPDELTTLADSLQVPPVWLKAVMLTAKIRLESQHGIKNLADDKEELAKLMSV